MKKQQIPRWAREDRLSDLVWITENLEILWPVAHEQFQKHGPGAIVVDTTVRPIGTGHPFTYMPRSTVNASSSADTQRMVREYDPKSEMVIVLLKKIRRESTYRVQTRT